MTQNDPAEPSTIIRWGVRFAPEDVIFPPENHPDHRAWCERIAAEEGGEVVMRTVTVSPWTVYRAS